MIWQLFILIRDCIRCVKVLQLLRIKPSGIVSHSSTRVSLRWGRLVCEVLLVLSFDVPQVAQNKGSRSGLDDRQKLAGEKCSIFSLQNILNFINYSMDRSSFWFTHSASFIVVFRPGKSYISEDLIILFSVYFCSGFEKNEEATIFHLCQQP